MGARLAPDIQRSAIALVIFLVASRKRLGTHTLGRFKALCRRVLAERVCTLTPPNTLRSRESVCGRRARLRFADVVRFSEFCGELQPWPLCLLACGDLPSEFIDDSVAR